MSVQAVENGAPVSVRYAQDMSEWNSLLSTASEVEGYSLIGGKDNERTMAMLVGVPQLIKNVTFRVGDIIPAGQDHPRDFASVEVLIHPDHAARFPRKYAVYNDGSTGVYRDIIKRLAKDGIITLPDGPVSGDANTTIYDVALTDREDGKPVEFTNLNLYCPEGLRVSEYKNEDGSGAQTYYLG